ncbi:hypothetical protein ACOMHN_019636 [Nucella lapillus]
MGSRQERTVESHLERQTLDDPDLRAALQAFSHIVDRSRGPHGYIQSLQNNVGGPVTTTTSSTRLLSALSCSRPCLRLIESAVQGHLKTHHDGGLLTASLCLHLVLNAVRLESVGRACVREAYSVFLQLVDDYLNAVNCPVRVNVDTSSLKAMLGYVRNIISTKPVCSLRPASASHLSQLALKAFLTSVPDSPQSFLSDCVYVLQLDKTDLMSSEVVEGLLLEWPEKCAQLGPQELVFLQSVSRKVKVMLVNVSMSGDAEETLTSQVEAQHHVVQSAADLIMTKMLAFCDWLVEHQVGLLLCQKVIHPKVKAYLRQRGVLFLERLGLQPMAYVQDLTGASPVSSILVRPADSVWGELTHVEHRILHGKSYVHLRKSNSCVCTLLMCAPGEQQLAELKCGMQSAMMGLSSTFQHPYLFCGGGCWQLHLAAYLRRMVRKKETDLCGELSITKAQLHACASAFASSLETVAPSLQGPAFQAWTDTSDCHLWPASQGVDLTTQQEPFSCACGTMTSSNVDTSSLYPLDKTHSCQAWIYHDRSEEDSVRLESFHLGDGVDYDWLVLDSADCVVSALRTAVLTSCTVLSFTQFIHDVN